MTTFDLYEASFAPLVFSQYFVLVEVVDQEELADAFEPLLETPREILAELRIEAEAFQVVLIDSTFFEPLYTADTW